jgi:hypothetical protein
VIVYSDATHESLKSFKMDYDIFYITYEVQEDVPAMFDKLSALAFSQAMNFINKHYCGVVCVPFLGTTSLSFIIVQPICTFCYSTTTALPNHEATPFWEVWHAQSYPSVSRGLHWEDGKKKENQTKRAVAVRKKIICCR